MTPGRQQRDDAERLRQFKAEFFKALAHPLRIGILELLHGGPLSVNQIQEATGAPGSSVSQQLAIIYSVSDPELFELLDVARRIFYAHLADTVNLLRLVDSETLAAGER